jgi:hypothetical protein
MRPGDLTRTSLAARGPLRPMIRALGLALVVALAGVAWQVWPGSSTTAGPRTAEAPQARVERAPAPPSLRPTDVPLRAEAPVRAVPTAPAVLPARPEPAPPPEPPRPAPVIVSAEPIVPGRPPAMLPPPAPPSPPEPAAATAFAPTPPPAPPLPPVPSRQSAAAAAPAPRTVVAARTVPADEEGATASDAVAGGAIDLNKASLAELNALRGGGSIGRAIIKGRPYESPEDLLRKRVLSRSTYDRIKGQIAVR